jgi:hypothetical protein
MKRREFRNVDWEIGKMSHFKGSGIEGLRKKVELKDYEKK